MAYVYILECADGTLYTGATRDLERRIAQHQSGRGAKYTRGRLPVRLVYAEFYDAIGEAFSREKRVQRLSRRQKLAVVESGWEGAIEVAKARQKANEP
ncbi:MAG: GIY-YIG nuclease family protein [Geitlerinemataceae cyanobacterium]